MIEEWKEITEDSKIIDVRPVSEERENKDRVGAFCEVFKYALKTSDMEVQDQFEAYTQLKGKRLIRSFGNLFGVKVQEDLNDDIETELEAERWVDVLFNWSEMFGYQQTKIIPADLEYEKSGKEKAA